MNVRVLRTFSVYAWNANAQRYEPRIERTGWLDVCQVVADALPQSRRPNFLVMDDTTGENLTERAIRDIDSWPTEVTE